MHNMAVRGGSDAVSLKVTRFSKCKEGIEHCVRCSCSALSISYAIQVACHCLKVMNYCPQGFDGVKRAGRSVFEAGLLRGDAV